MVISHLSSVWGSTFGAPGDVGRHTLILEGSVQFEYEFVVDGDVYDLQDNGHTTSNVGVNDNITENPDGTLTVSGVTGSTTAEAPDVLFVGDAYEISGDLLELSYEVIQDASGAVELFVDGHLMSPDEIVDHITPECGADSDCPDGAMCENGTCVNDPSSTIDPSPACEPGECPDGYECQNGNCVQVPDCTGNADCGSGQECRNGVCIDMPDPSPACTSGECPAGYECDGGVCVQIPDCSADPDCAEGEVCESGVCIPDPGGNGPGQPGDPCSGDGECAGSSTCDDGTCSQPPDQGSVGMPAILLLVLAVVGYFAGRTVRGDEAGSK